MVRTQKGKGNEWMELGLKTRETRDRPLNGDEVTENEHRVGRSGEKGGEQTSEDLFRVHGKDARDDCKKESEDVFIIFFVTYVGSSWPCYPAFLFHSKRF